MLNPGQIAYFETFGFLVLRNLFSTEETDALRDTSLHTLQALRGGGPYTGEKAESGLPFLERDPILAGLVDDDRIHQIPESLLGPDFFLDFTGGYLRMGDTPWHGDTEYPEDFGNIKVTMYLDPVARETGCLRVIPGSHKHGSPDYFEVLRSLRSRTYEPDFRPFGLAQTDVPCCPLETEPGDVVVFTERLLHGSFGGVTGRHQLAVNFVAHPTSDDQLDHMLAFYAKTKYCYRPAKSYVNSDRPRIRRMVSLQVELGFDQANV